MNCKTFLLIGFMCSLCGVTTNLRGNTPAAVKLVLPEHLYERYAKAFALQLGCFSLGDALLEFSNLMTAFEIMRTSLKCYLEGDRAPEEVKQGLTGLSRKEFKKLADTIPKETKIAYQKAVREVCSKTFYKVLKQY